MTKASFDAIIARVEELENLLDELVVLATTALDLLEAEPFDPARHAARFQRALTLTVAVRDVATTPVVDVSGNLNEETSSYEVRYRALIKDVVDV